MKKTDGSGGKGGRRRSAADGASAGESAAAVAQPSQLTLAAVPAPAPAPAPAPVPVSRTVPAPALVPVSRTVPAGADVDPLGEFFVSSEERALVASSFGLDGSGRGPAVSDVLELLAFWAADEEYALPIAGVQEIIKVPTITELPRAHPVVLGIISLRGTIVPVVDLRRVLRLEERPLGRQARILVVHGEDDAVGLLVDRVTSVVRFEADQIEATPRTMQRQSSELVRGVGRLDGRLIIVLDPRAVLTVMDSAA